MLHHKPAIYNEMIHINVLVWWPKAEATVKVLLQKIQRLAFLRISGIMLICPTAETMEMMKLFFLHLQVKEAMPCALRLNRTMNFRPGDILGHLKILENVKGMQMSKLMSDHMPQALELNKTFEVVLTSRQIWKTGRSTYRKGSLL